MEIKEWLEEFRKERELLIEKTKWGTYASVMILVATFINIYTVWSNREEALFPALEPYIQKIIILILLSIITIGSLFLLLFSMRNYRRYQKIEQIIDNWMEKEIPKDLSKK